jgi:hypothetical protein
MGYVNSFEGLLWPHRSSPLACLYDMDMEIQFMLSKKRDTKIATSYDRRKQ